MSDQQQQIQEILKKSLLKIKTLEAELSLAKQTIHNEEVAIVGTGTRFPGGINSLEALYEILKEKNDVITTIPSERFDINKYYDEDSYAAGKTNTKYGAFLKEDVKAFDAGFFDIAPREAKSIDPLQRMMLEVVYEALEHAGIAPDSLKGSNTDVFVAVGNSDYIQARFRSGDITKMDVYDATGIPFATAAGRISYIYDLQGQSYALDAACSSSLVALHQAKQNLGLHISDTAIVIAANLILTPELYVGLSKLGSLSPSGKCRAFDDNGDGYVRGEGCGVLVLKRTQDAIRDHLNIYAIVKGTAIKHDGTSNGFTAPNPVAQQSVIKAAIGDAKCDPKDVLYVEAHGIGNKLTDGMELQAIATGYSRSSKYVGSLKPNIGHLEAATGMAMIQKIIVSLQHKVILPNINFDIPNTDINWSLLQLSVAKDSQDIQSESPVLMAVNLSGYSGTNTHAIFQEAPLRVESLITDKTALFTLSAKDSQALKELCNKYLNTNGWKDNIFKTCYTLQTGRTHYDHKLSIVAHDTDTIMQGLHAYISEDNFKGLSSSTSSEKGNIAFLFTGQGAQYFGMGRYLFETNSFFRSKIEECNLILQESSNMNIITLLYENTDEADSIHQTANTQPTLFVIEYATACLFIALGLKPSVLIGHSIGEYVALTISGALTLVDALKIVVERGRLMQSLPNDIGAMAAVLSSIETISPYLRDYQDKIDVAAINSPNMLTISGEKEAIDTLVQKLKSDGIKTVPLNVSHAFHSLLMAPILDQFKSFVAQFRILPLQIPVMSNISGKNVEVSELTPDYFAKHLRNTVLFSENIQNAVVEYGIDTFIECGPNPTLLGFANSILTTNPLMVAPMKKGGDESIQWWAAMALLYHKGFKIDWRLWYSEKIILPADNLPTYPWQRKIYWENPVRENLPTTEASSIQNQIPIAKMAVSKEHLMATMQMEAAHVLGLEPGQRVDISRSLREQGFDSMMSGEYLSRMEKHLNTSLEMSLLHLYGTQELLHRHFIDTYFGGGEVEGTTAVTMNDIMFGGDLAQSASSDDWHEIKDSDAWWLKIFKKIDKKFA